MFQASKVSVFACYAHNAERLEQLEPSGEKPFTLSERQFEIFWLVPIQNGWAALGLADKFNGPAALVSVQWDRERRCTVHMKDQGEFLAFSERVPESVRSGPATGNGPALPFRHDAASSALRVSLGSRDDRVFTIQW